MPEYVANVAEADVSDGSGAITDARIEHARKCGNVRAG